MADTITVLNGIQFQKETTSDVYTQDHATNSAVASVPVKVPVEAKTVRVIVNGAFDPDGGRIHWRAKAVKVTSITTPTKTANTQAQEWVTLTPPAVAEVDGIDFSASWGGFVIVDLCQSSVTANTTGIQLIVQMLTEDSVEEWVTIHDAIYLVFTAVATKSDFAAQEAAGQTLLDVTNPATGGLNNIGKFIFLEDTATIAQCEIAYLVSQTGD